MTDHFKERRAIKRIHAIWQRLASHRFPSQAEIDPKEFGADWSNCLVMKIDAGRVQPRYLDGGLDQNCISQPLAETLLALAQRHISQVLATEKPVAYGGTASHEGKDILYRIILLPLSEDKSKIDGLLAGMTYREIPQASELRLSDIAWGTSPLNRHMFRDDGSNDPVQ